MAARPIATRLGCYPSGSYIDKLSPHNHLITLWCFEMSEQLTDSKWAFYSVVLFPSSCSCVATECHNVHMKFQPSVTLLIQ